MAQTHLPPQWRERVLADLNSRGWNYGNFAHESMRFLEAWQRAEGGSAKWNPLNTTLHVFSGQVPWQELTDYNAAKVCNYKTPTFGVMATVATLQNGYYWPLVGFLQAPGMSADDACDAFADEIRTWGTNPDLMKQVLKEIP